MIAHPLSEDDAARFQIRLDPFEKETPHGCGRIPGYGNETDKGDEEIGEEKLPQKFFFAMAYSLKRYPTPRTVSMAFAALPSFFLNPTI